MCYPCSYFNSNFSISFLTEVIYTLNARFGQTFAAKLCLKLKLVRTVTVYGCISHLRQFLFCRAQIARFNKSFLILSVLSFWMINFLFPHLFLLLLSHRFHSPFQFAHTPAQLCNTHLLKNCFPYFYFAQPVSFLKNNYFKKNSFYDLFSLLSLPLYHRFPLCFF